MSDRYDRKAAARYWGGERLFGQDELAVVLSYGEPRLVNEAYHLWETSMILRELQPLRNLSVVDVGCGVGRVSAVLASHGARISAVDSALPMLVRCRKRMAIPAADPFTRSEPEERDSPPTGNRAKPRGSLRGNRPAHPVQAEATRLPFDASSFDAAVCVGLLEHLPPKQRRTTLTELVRVVRSEGRVVIVVNNAQSELLNREEDNPHRKGRQYQSGYYCALVGRDEVASILQELKWSARVLGANTFYSLLRFRLHADPMLEGAKESLEGAFRSMVELDLNSTGRSEADRRWADHFFLLAERK